MAPTSPLGRRFIRSCFLRVRRFVHSMLTFTFGLVDASLLTTCSSVEHA